MQTPDFGSPGRLLSRAIGALRSLLPDAESSPPSSRSDQLRAAFSAAVKAKEETNDRGADRDVGIPVYREQLRHQVSLFAVEMRDSGLPPEQMLVTLKTELKGTSQSRRPSASDSLFTDVIRWAIDAYFAR